MPSFSRRRALAASGIGLALTVLLTACGGLSYTPASLSKLVTSAETPTGYSVQKSVGSSRASDAYQQAVGLFRAAHGTPAKCSIVPAAEVLASANDFKAGNKDEIRDLVRYSAADDNDRVFEALTVTGRVFADDAAAKAFMTTVTHAAAACVNGYRVQAASFGGSTTRAFREDSVASTRITGLPRTVASVQLSEMSIDQAKDPSFSVSYLQSGNAVLAVTAGIAPGHSINYEVSNVLVEKLAKRLAASTANRG